MGRKYTPGLRRGVDVEAAVARFLECAPREEGCAREPLRKGPRATQGRARRACPTFLFDFVFFEIRTDHGALLTEAEFPHRPSNQ